MCRASVNVLIGAVLSVVLANEPQAQISGQQELATEKYLRIGPSVGYHINLDDLFLGPQVLIPLKGRTATSPGAWYVFTEGTTRFFFSTNIVFDIDESIYMGTGLLLDYIKRDIGDPSSQTEFGMNYLVGLEINSIHPRIQPFIEARLLSDFLEFNSFGFTLLGGIHYRIKRD